MDGRLARITPCAARKMDLQGHAAIARYIDRLKCVE
jgi:hypothetical protein